MLLLVMGLTKKMKKVYGACSQMPRWLPYWLKMKIETCFFFNHIKFNLKFHLETLSKHLGII